MSVQVRKTSQQLATVIRLILSHIITDELVSCIEISRHLRTKRLKITKNPKFVHQNIEKADRKEAGFSLNKRAKRTENTPG